MDRTVLPLSVASGLLVAMLAPHATLTLATIIALSAIATWGAWALLQTLGQSGETPRSAID